MNLDQGYWENRYESADKPWQLPVASPPLMEYMRQRSDRKAQILIPGAGSGLEAKELTEMGYHDIHMLDISMTAIQQVSKTISEDSDNGVRFYLEDFFDHQGSYDIILEQTFFCALEPRFRESYVKKCHELLKANGELIGVLFDRTFEENPPYGGNEDEYKRLFQPFFKIDRMETSYNSYGARQGNEFFIRLKNRAHGY